MTHKNKIKKKTTTISEKLNQLLNTVCGGWGEMEP
jgi:hypothetical protein